MTAETPTRDDRVDRVYARVGVLGTSREQHLTAAAIDLDDIIDVVRHALEQGVDLNLAEVLRCSGIAKRTLYERLPADLVAARHAPTDNSPEARRARGLDPIRPARARR